MGGSGREQVIHRDLVLRVEWDRGIVKQQALERSSGEAEESLFDFFSS